MTYTLHFNIAGKEWDEPLEAASREEAIRLGGVDAGLVFARLGADGYAAVFDGEEPLGCWAIEGGELVWEAEE